MTLEQKMAEEGYTKKEILVCPKCGEVLRDKDYDTYTEYHNALTGHCRKCGHDDYWGYFYKTVYVKHGSIT